MMSRAQGIAASACSLSSSRAVHTPINTCAYVTRPAEIVHFTMVKLVWCLALCAITQAADSPSRTSSAPDRFSEPDPNMGRRILRGGELQHYLQCVLTHKGRTL